MNPKVDFYFSKGNWQQEINLLRRIILECGVEEVLKWGVPTYTYNDANVVLVHVFKEYCAVLFFKGSLLNDPKGILVQQTKNVQAARQMRFTGVDQIKKNQAELKAYIYEAIELERAGIKPVLKKTTEFEMPEEFKNHLDKNKKLAKAYEALTPGRQRAYLLHFSSAKQSKTREARIEKSIPDILAGKGLNDM